MKVVFFVFFFRDAEFCTDGIRYLAQMVEKSYFVPVVQCLFYIVPMFYQSPSYLTSSTVYVTIIELCLDSFIHCFVLLMVVELMYVDKVPAFQEIFIIIFLHDMFYASYYVIFFFLTLLKIVFMTCSNC